MKLKQLVFPGYVFGQSGVQGFFGEGDEYPHHKFYKYIRGFSLKEMVFVAKTVTLKPRIYPESSNTELCNGYKVKQLFPKSIWWSIWSFIRGYLLNAVGLANEGLYKHLEYGKWQKRRDVFQISVMLMATTFLEKIKEAEEICKILSVNFFPTTAYHQYAIQINFSCPNTGHEQAQDVKEIVAVLKVFREYFPIAVLIPKFDLLVEPSTIAVVKRYCDAFCIANTLPFGKKKDANWWKRLFKNGVSPLQKYFKGKFQGGLSGSPLFPLLVDWLEKMEQYDPAVVIIAGGGIMKKKDIDRLAQFNIVHGIALGSVAILRPWRMRSLIDYGNKIFSQKMKTHELTTTRDYLVQSV